MEYAHEEHPLHHTFRTVEEVVRYIKPHLGEPDEVGWLAPETLFLPTSDQLQRWIAIAEKELQNGTANMVGTTVLQRYQWSLVSTALVSYLYARRVPDLSLANVRFYLADEKRIDRVAFVNKRFAALPDDVAAGHPDAIVVANPAELRDYMRRGLEAHLGAFIELIHRQVGSSPRALWLVMTDNVADEMIWFMQKQDATRSRAEIEAEVKAVVQQPDSKLYHRKLELFDLTYKEQTHTYRDRLSCCYWYKCDGGEYCSVCPHRMKEERVTLLLQHLAEEYAG